MVMTEMPSPRFSSTEGGGIVGREIVFGRAAHLRFFLSSRMSDHSLDAERRIAARTVMSLGFALPWWWEESGVASPLPAEDICVETARTSDGLLLLLGDSLTDVTRREYEAARDAGAPCFIFIRQGDQSNRVKAFIKAERPHVTTANFRTASELGTAITKALRRHTVTSWRLAIVTGSATTGLPSRIEDSRQGGDMSLRGDVDPSELDELFAGIAREVGKADPNDALQDLIALAEQGLHVARADRVQVMFDSVLPSIDTSNAKPELLGWRENAQGRTQSSLGRFDEARATFARMLEVGRELDDDRMIGTALQNMGVVALQMNDVDLAEDLARQALELLESGDSYPVLQLRLNLANAALDRNDLEEVERLLDQVEPEARRHAFHHLVAAVNGTRGVVASERGNIKLAETLLRRTLTSARRREDVQDEVIALQNLGATFGSNNQLARAVHWYRQAIRVAASLGLSLRLGLLQRSLGSVLYRLDRFEESADAFREASQVSVALGDVAGDAWARADLGALQLTMEHPDADRTLAGAFADLVLLGDRGWQARVLYNLATTRYETEPDFSRHLLELALVALDDDQDRVNLHQRVAPLYLRGSKVVGSALAHIDAALSLQERELDTEQVAWEYGRAATLLSEAGYNESALDYYDRGLALATEKSHVQVEFHLRNDRGILLEDMKRGSEAIEDLQTCLRIAIGRRDRVMQQQARYNLGETARRVGDLELAIAETRRSVRLARDLDDAQNLAGALVNLGSVHISRDASLAAKLAFEEGLTLAQDNGLDSTAARALDGLGNSAFIESNYAVAIEFYEQAGQIWRQLEEWPRYVLTLGARLEARASFEDLSDEVVQNFVDEAQTAKSDALAAKALARTARALHRRGNSEAAMDLWALAITLPGMQANRGNAGDEVIGQEMLAAAMLMVAQLEDDLGEAADAAYERVKASLEANHDAPGEIASMIVDTARDVMRNLETPQKGMMAEDT